jgi:hypothetical protein
MTTHFAQWSLILLCFSMAAAIGGGLYEHIVLTPLWRKSPPASFAIFQPGTGVPLQRFWIPVHAAITLFVVLALVLTWRDPSVRRLLLIGLGSYIVMRVWSGLYFIPEMLAFQKIPLDAAPSAELSARVSKWNFWSRFREPLDVVAFLCFLLALYEVKGPRVALSSLGADLSEGTGVIAGLHAQEECFNTTPTLFGDFANESDPRLRSGTRESN